jgi:hypothetical protein
MKIKNFVSHTRPSGKKIRKTISDINKQIHYLESIGRREELDYYKNQRFWLRKRLKGIN